MIPVASTKESNCLAIKIEAIFFFFAVSFSFGFIHWKKKKKKKKKVFCPSIFPTEFLPDQQNKKNQQKKHFGSRSLCVQFFFLFCFFSNLKNIQSFVFFLNYIMDLSVTVINQEFWIFFSLLGCCIFGHSLPFSILFSPFFFSFFSFFCFIIDLTPDWLKKKSVDRLPEIFLFFFAKPILSDPFPFDFSLWSTTWKKNEKQQERKITW